MGNKFKRVLSLLMTLLMIVTSVNIPVYAAEADSTVVAKIDTAEYTSLDAALAEAKSGDTIDIVQDINVAGECNFTVPAGVTIDGGENTLTIAEVGHYSNMAAFYSEGSYSVKDLIITLTNRTGTRIAFQMNNGGELSNVTVNGAFAYGVYVGSGDVTIDRCTFANGTESSDYGVYSESADLGTIKITNNTFNVIRAAVLYDDEIFTGNIVNGDKGVSVATGNATITGNEFNGARAMSISADAAISGNQISAESCVECSADADLSGNYWGGDAPGSTQLVPEGTGTLTVKSYYTTVAENGNLDNLVEVQDAPSYVVKNETTGVTYDDLAAAVSAANANEVILLNVDVDSFPTIDKPLTIKGAVEGIEVNCAIAENFPNIEGTVTFENLTFNKRISTENNSSDQSKLTLKFVGCTFNISEQYAIQGGSTASTPGNDVLGGLTIEDCIFNTVSTSYIGNYMVYAQCVNNLSITGSAFTGNSLYKGAVHTGDSVEQATVAVIENNSFDGFPRGIQIGNRVEGSSVSVAENSFVNINATDNESKSGAIYVHGNADNNVAVTVTNNDFETLETVLYNDKNIAEGDNITDIITTFTGNTLSGENLYFDETSGLVYAKPILPTATVTELENENLTFALNFKADEATEAQLTYYGGWYADFVLTVNQDVTFNANGGADGYLSGQYDAWSEEWVNVPLENVTLKANESLKIMEYAAELMNQSGLKVTYNDVYTNVNDFDCGVFFEPEFLSKLTEDLEVTLELRMYNPEDETESYVIGETYTFEYGKLPTATVTEIENENLTFAMNFKADEVSEATLNTYGGWYADYVLTVNKDVTFNANGGADGYLSGQYDAWSENWVDVPFEDVALAANTPLKIMEYAAELMGQSGLKYTYGEVYNAVKDFDCGVFFDEEFLKANPDLKVTLELRMYNPADETESYVIGDTYIFTTEAVAMNTATGVVYLDVMEGLFDAEAGQTVILLKDVETTTVTVPESITFDLDGHTLTTSYFACFGDTVDYSDENTGLLKVAEDRILMQKDNEQLPVKNGEGYQFFSLINFRDALLNNGSKYAFEPAFEVDAHEILLKGSAVTGVTVNARVTWGSAGTRSQDFVYTDAYVTEFLGSYKADTGKYGKMFALYLSNNDKYENLIIQAVVISDTGVEIAVK